MEVVLTEEELHPVIEWEDGWWYGLNILSNAEHRPEHIFSTIWPRVKGPAITSPLLIPETVVYLDSLLYQRNNYRESKPELASISNWQIRNLVRYLYLELPRQNNTLLFQLSGDTENYMGSYFQGYKRKPFYVLPSSCPKGTCPFWRGERTLRATQKKPRVNGGKKDANG